MRIMKRKFDMSIHVEVDFFQRLPRELVQDVLQFLPAFSLVKLTCVNKFLMNEANSSANTRIRQLCDSFLASNPHDRTYNPLKTLYFINRWNPKNAFYILHYLTCSHENWSKTFCVDIACGIGHTIVLHRASGRVFSCGEGSNGQLGHGNGESIDIFQEVRFRMEAPDERIVSVHAAPFHSAFLTNRSRIFMAGEGADGRLGLGDDRSRSVPTLMIFNTQERVSSVSVGNTHGLILTDAGNVFAFGKSRYGALGLGKSIGRAKSPRMLKNHFNNEKIILVAASTFHSMFLSESGAVYSCGMAKYGCGHAFVDDELIFWPKNIEYFTERNIKITAISTGGYHSLCLSASGEVFSFGKSGGGRLGNVSEAAAYDNPFVAIPSKLNLSFLVMDVVAGETHSLIITSRGKAYTFGVNMYGKLGLGDENDRYFPEEVTIFQRSSDEGLLSISSDELFITKGQIGDWHTILTTNTGQVFTCGGGWFGRLGLGFNRHDNVSRPRLVNLPVVNA